MVRIIGRFGRFVCPREGDPRSQKHSTMAICRLQREPGASKGAVGVGGNEARQPVQGFSRARGDKILDFEAILTSRFCSFVSNRRLGFTNLALLKEGKSWRGEEHDIELVWSVKSGKTRVFWNGNNISHYFREEHLFEEVNFSWESGTGERFQILASEKPCIDRPQYELLVDGFSFFSLPKPSQLRLVDNFSAAVSVLSDDDEVQTVGSTDIEPVPENALYDETEADNSDIRLAMAGLSAPSLDPPEKRDSLEDELTSDLFTNSLERLRQRVTAMIPSVDDLVSRAIVNAFSGDRDSSSSFSSCSFESTHPSHIHIEMSAIWDALSLNDSESQADFEEQKQELLQKQIDSIFVHVRQGNLTEDAAVRILCNVATLVGLELKVPARKDTIALRGLGEQTTEDALLLAMGSFGEVSDVAISKGRRFGVCRFRSESSASKAVAAASTGDFLVNGCALGLSLLEHRPKEVRQALSERAPTEPNPNLPMPSLERRKSHQRNTVTIDTSMASGTFLTVPESVEPLVEPDASKSLLQPNVFVNIPATPSSSPLVFDSPIVSPLS